MLEDKIKGFENSKITEDKTLSLLFDDWIGKPSDYAYLTPDSTTFRAVATQEGLLFFSIKDVAKYANGYKVTVQIGNPNAVHMSNVKLSIQFGKKGTIPNFKDATASKIEMMQTNLMAGTRTDYQFKIAPATEDDIAYIAIKPEIGQIFYLR